MKPIITQLPYTYKKKVADVSVLNTKDIPLDFSTITDSQIVILGPQSIGGNHKHPRTEWFIAIGELELSWLDDIGTKQSVHMNPDNQLYLIEIPSFLPHAVKNISTSEKGILFDYADGVLENEIDVEVVITN